MKHYQVLLAGENFLIKSEGSVRRLGFATTRRVESEDVSGAELAAVELIRQDKSLRKCVLNDPSDPPMIFAEEFEEISRSTFDKYGPGAGYTFYDQDSEGDQ